MDHEILKVLRYLPEIPLEEYLSYYELLRLREQVTEAITNVETPSIDGLKVPDVESTEMGCAVKESSWQRLVTYCGKILYKRGVFITTSLPATCPHCVKAYHDPSYINPTLADPTS